MSVMLWPFVIGISVGALATWVTLWLGTATTPAHTHTRTHEHLTVQRITARIEREHRESSGTSGSARHAPRVSYPEPPQSPITLIERHHAPIR